MTVLQTVGGGRLAHPEFQAEQEGKTCKAPVHIVERSTVFYEAMEQKQRGNEMSEGAGGSSIRGAREVNKEGHPPGGTWISEVVTDVQRKCKRVTPPFGGNPTTRIRR